MGARTLSPKGLGARGKRAYGPTPPIGRQMGDEAPFVALSRFRNVSCPVCCGGVIYTAPIIC